MKETLLKFGIKLIVPIIKAGKSKLEKEYYTFRKLKALELVTLKDNFTSIYFHTLLNLEVKYSKTLIKLFSLEQVRKAFQNNFRRDNDWELEAEFISNLHTNPSVRMLKNENIDVDIVLKEFQKEFSSTIEKVKSPSQLKSTHTEDETLKLVKEIHASKDPSLVLNESFLKELDYPKELIKNFNPTNALEYLKKFKKDKWTSCNDIVKYKVLANIGICNFQLHKEKKAARFLLEAYEYNKDDHKAIGFAALGYALSNNKEGFDKLYEVAISKDEIDPLIYTSLIILEDVNTPVDELVKKIPTDVAKKSEIAYSISIFAKKKQDNIAVLFWLEKAMKGNIEKHPDLCGAIASNLLELIANPQLLITQQVDPKIKEKVNRGIELLTKAWNSIKDDKLKKSRYFWMMNRGVAKILLGDISGAYEDFKVSYEFDEKNVKRHLAIAARDIGKYDEAIMLFEELIKEDREEDKEVSLEIFLAEAYYRNDQLEKAILLLEDYLRKSPKQRRKIEAYSLLVSSALVNNDLDKAVQYNNISKTEAPNEILTHISSARIERFKKNNDRIIKDLVQAKQFINKHSLIEDIYTLGQEFYKSNDFENAIEVFEPIVNLDTTSGILKRLLSSYYAVERYHDLIEISSNLRKKQIIDIQIIESEITALGTIGRLNDAITLCTEFLDFFPNKDLAYAELALLHHQNKKLDQCKIELNKIENLVQLPYDLAFQLAYLHMELGQTRESIDAGYELRRLNFNHHHGHENFIKLLLNAKEDIKEFLICEEVKKDSAVTIEWDNKSKVTYIIEGREEVSISMDEIQINDPLVQKILGKKVNDTVEIETAFGQTKKATIVSISTKYSYARDKSFELLESTFADQSQFFIFNAASSDEEETPVNQLLDMISKMADADKERNEQIEKQYKSGMLPIGLFSRLMQKNEIEIWAGVTSDTEYGIKPTMTLPQEFSIAVNHIKNGKSIVFDVVSLLSLNSFKDFIDFDKINSEFIVGKLTLDVFNTFIDFYEGFGSGERITISKEGDQLIRHITTKEQIKEDVAKIKSLKEWVLKHCEINDSNELFRLKKSRRDELYKILGKSTTESIFLAKEHDSLLYSDEAIVRSLALNEVEVNGLSSPIFLRNELITENINRVNYDNAVVKLLKLNYKGLMIDKEVLMHSLSESDFKISRPFTSALEILEGQNSNLDSAVNVAIGFLKDLYVKIQIKELRDRVSLSIISSLMKNRNKQQVLLALGSIVQREFSLLPIHKKEIETLIFQWIDQKT